MNRVKFLSLTIVALVILNIGVISFLLLGKPRPEGRDGRPDKIIIEKLQLNAKQIEEFEKLKRQHHEAVRSYQDSIRILKRSFIDALRTDHPDQEQAEKIAGDISGLQKKIEMATFIHFKSLRELCDERQKVLFDEFIQEIARMFGRPPGPPEKNKP